jgi:hypothetical protein
MVEQLISYPEEVTEIHPNLIFFSGIASSNKDNDEFAKCAKETNFFDDVTCYTHGVRPHTKFDLNGAVKGVMGALNRQPAPVFFIHSGGSETFTRVFKRIMKENPKQKWNNIRIVLASPAGITDNPRLAALMAVKGVELLLDARKGNRLSQLADNGQTQESKAQKLYHSKSLVELVINSGWGKPLAAFRRLVQLGAEFRLVLTEDDLFFTGPYKELLVKSLELKPDDDIIKLSGKHGFPVDHPQEFFQNINVKGIFQHE